MKRRHIKHHKQLINGYKLGILSVVAIYLATLAGLFFAYHSGSLGMTVSVWNVPVQLYPGEMGFGAMFDAFDNHLILNSSQPITLAIMTPWEYGSLYNCASTTYNYSSCLSANATVYRGSHINVWFNLSEGCAGYVYVIYSDSDNPAYIKPDVSAHYNPAAKITGVC